MTDRKRKADVLGRLDSSSTLGRGSLSGWTTCPLCPPNRKKQFALGRGISAHLYAVHTPWLPTKQKKRSKKQRRGENEGDSEALTSHKGWDPTAKEEEAWAQQVLELTAKLEKNSQTKPGVDRTGKPSKSYVESLPPFLQAACNGDIAELKRMLTDADRKNELAALLSTRDRNGSTPEHWAAGGGHLESLRLLLEKRDSLPKELVTEDESSKKKKLRRRDGKTCLHYAARNGRLDCVRYLIEKRGDAVDARSGDGTTPLHMACFGGAPSVVEYLTKQDAKVGAVNDWDCNAAHWTAMSQSEDHEEVITLCQVLHKAGVSFVSVQKQGHSALHKAAQKQNRHVVEWMAKPKELGGPALTEKERDQASKPDTGGHRPSNIWSAAGGDSTVADWIKMTFETS